MQLRNICAFFILMLVGQHGFGQTVVYWVGGSGDWNDITHWSATSGGPGGFQTPNIQINAVFDENSFTAAGQVVTIGGVGFGNGNAFCQDLDWSAATNNPTFRVTSANTEIDVSGSVLFTPNMTLDFLGQVNFTSTDPGNVILNATHSFGGPLVFNGFGGEWELADELHTEDQTLDFMAGIFRSNGHPITANSIVAITAEQVTIDLDTSDVFLFERPLMPPSIILRGDDITFIGGDPFIQTINSEIFFIGDNGVIDLQGDGQYNFGIVNFATGQASVTSTVSLSFRTFNQLVFNSEGFISGNHTILSLILDNGHTLTLANGSTQIIEDIAATGDPCTGDVRVVSQDINGPRPILDFFKNQYTAPIYFSGIDLLVLGDITEGITFFRGFDGGSNSENLDPTGISKFVYWVNGGDDGDWTNPANWSSTSGGPGGACVPTAADNVFIDDNSFPAGTTNNQIISAVPIYLNGFSLTTPNFQGRITMPSLTIIAQPTSQNEEPALTITITNPSSWEVDVVTLYSTDRAGDEESADNIHVDAATGVIRQLVINGEPEGRVRLAGDLVVQTSIDVIGDVEFDTDGFNVETPILRAENHPVILEVDDGSTITITGMWDGVNYPLTINNISDLMTDESTQWIFTNEQSGFNVDMGTLGNVTFTSSTGLSRMLVLQDVAITNLTIMNDGSFLGSTYAIDSLIFTAGHRYELDAGSDVSVSAYFEGLGDMCNSITLTSRNGPESITLDAAISLELSYMSIDNVPATGGSFFAGPGSQGVNTTTGWTFPTPMDNLMARQFLGADVAACNDSIIILPPSSIAIDIQSITWKVNGVDMSTDPVFQIPPNATEVIAEVMTMSGCPISDTINVNLAPFFNVDFGADRDVCQGSTTTLSDPAFTDPAATYAWNTGADTPDLTVSTSDEYIVTVTRTGCVDIDTVNVTRIELEPFGDVLGLTDSISLCEGATMSYAAPSFTNSTFVWNDNTTSDPLIVSEGTLPPNGFYYIEVTEGSCTDRDSLHVTFDPAITQVLTDMSDTVVCADVTFNLSVVPGFDSVSWNTGSMDFTIQSISNLNQTYRVEAFRGACIASEERMVMATAPIEVILDSDITLCENETQQLIKPSNINTDIMWIEESSGATLTTEDTLDVPVVVGTSEYILEAQVGVCTGRDTVAVTFEAAPVLDFTTRDTTICAGASINLSVTSEANVDYSWSSGQMTNSITVSTADNYILVAERATCVVTDSVNVGVLDLDANSFSIGPRDTSICRGEVLTLDASLPGSVTYNWVPANSGPIFDVSAADQYSIEVRSGDCFVTDTINVNVDEPALFSLHQQDNTLDTVICEGSVLSYPLLTFPDAAWSDFTGNMLSTDPNFEITDAGSYELAVTTGACIVRDSIVVAVQALPTLDLEDNIVACAGDEIKIGGPLSSGVSYLWSTSETTDSIVVLTDGTYKVTATENNCPATDSSIVIFNALPQVVLPNDMTLCEGDSTLLFNGNDITDTYDLTLPGSTNPTTPADEVYAQEGGLYVLQLTNADNCMLQDTFMLALDPTPFFDLADSTGLCAGLSRELTPDFTGGQPTRLRWSTADGNSTITVRTSDAGKLWLDAFIDSGNGECLWTDTTFVSVQDLPVVDLDDSATICSDSVLVLDASTAGVTYLWSTGETSPTIDVSQEDTYKVVVDIKGCLDSAMIDVTTIQAPDVEIGMDTTICEGDMITLSTGNSSWVTSWSTGETTPDIEVTGGDMYQVTVEDNGCTDTDDIMIGSALLPVFDLGEDLSVCDQVGTSLAVDATDVSVIWNTGETTNVINVTELGEYIATATSGDGCSSQDSITISSRECARFEIYRPNAFTPNPSKEGNEIFKVTPTPNATISSFDIKIFNRWGNLMYTSNDINAGWNGRIGGVNGQLSNPGVFTYVIEVVYSDDFDTDRRDFIHGNVTLLD